MLESMYDIRALSTEEAQNHQEGLAELLIDAVNGGAVLGILPPLGLARARSFWHNVAVSLDGENRVLLVAFDEHGRVAGSAQLIRSDEDDGRHRADIRKVLVHRSHRRRGLGRRLMIALEDQARDLGLRLLILDTETDGVAERLYHGLGWVRLGSIPDFARDPNADANDEATAATYFYKTMK